MNRHKRRYCDDVYKILNKDLVFINSLSVTSIKQVETVNLLKRKYQQETSIEIRLQDLGLLLTKSSYGFRNSIVSILSKDIRFIIQVTQLTIKLSVRAAVVIDADNNIENYCNQVVHLLSIDSLLLNGADRNSQFASITFNALGSRIRKERYGLKNKSFAAILSKDARLVFCTVEGRQSVKLSNHQTYANINANAHTNSIHTNNNTNSNHTNNNTNSNHTNNNTNSNNTNNNTNSNHTNNNTNSNNTNNNTNSNNTNNNTNSSHTSPLPKREDLEKDKVGISIEKNIKVSIEIHHTISKSIRIKDTSNSRRRPWKLRDVNFLTHIGFKNIAGCFSITRGESEDSYDDAVAINYNPLDIGVHKCIIVFHFGRDDVEPCIQIARFISGRCYGDKNLYDTLNDGAPFKRKKRVTEHIRIREDEIIESDKPKKNRINPFIYKLAPYKVPKELRSAEFDEVEFERSLIEKKRSIEVKDYSEFFRDLLYHEELHWEVDIRYYDMKDVPITHEGSLIKICVPGLYEKRPSVLRGDPIIFIYNGEKFRGEVSRVELSHVLIGFHSRLHKSILNNSMVNVVFGFKRTPLRLCHQGLELLKTKLGPAASRIIHPLPCHEDIPSITPSRTFFNRNLNDQQKQAVENVCSSKGEAPFIIFGPPGTGKTETIVEVIRQMHRNSDSKILVMAPSNEAACNLLRRLTSIPKSEMFRLVAHERDRRLVDDIVMPYCLYETQDHSSGFHVPKLERLKEYRVVVSTLIMASKLYNMGIEDDHFNSFIIDEAGYSWEPDIIAVLGPLKGKQEGDDGTKQTVILAGDPKQLGPIVRSPLSLKLGLGVSMIERLTDSSSSYVYSKNLDLFPNSCGYNPKYIVKLLKCYRCHPDILNIPNELFYDGELESVADPVRANSMLRWNGLINSNFPLIFHGIDGENLRENNSPSWFNIAEIEACLSYVKQLKESMRFLGFTLKDICIITPYNQQVVKLRKALALIDCSDVACGSVETFQGQERKIVILSSVRSDPKYIEVDVNYNLGFIKSPKRFNVSITRAIALLIIIGSPKTLNTDPNWSKLLWYCVDNNSYTGMELPKRVDSDDGAIDENLSAALQGFSINDDIDNDNDNDNDNGDNGDNEIVENRTIDRESWI